MTTLCKLVAKEEDIQGYINYVFECLEQDEIKRLDTKYILTTRFPNWNHRSINIGEIGYLDFIEIRAGIDKWFNGINMIPYNYNMIQFLKFIEKPKKDKYEFIMQINFMFYIS